MKNGPRESCILQYYNLERLLEPFDFPTEPQDGIEEVKLLMIKLKPINDQCSLTFDVDDKNKKPIREIISRWFDVSNPFNAGFSIQQVKFTLTFYSRKILYVTLGYPSFMDMRHLSEEEQEVTMKYLKKWQLIQEY